MEVMCLCAFFTVTIILNSQDGHPPLVRDLHEPIVSPLLLS